ncbi:hypothetical protein HYFRA_00012030 [Hymenoscyphus fraxineus]|uniref:Ubiquitin-like protease family profile domain-containing protein n=1 Tax=Hymenoscyphus fraxineus TaxID=746836 RepID=A0A9N9L0P6_9HELO|nr:hypothetical protein HYFRA_00012030 [Hymenoscyphus fraxineus]
MKRKAHDSIEDHQEYSQYLPATPPKRQNMGASHSTLSSWYPWGWLCSLASPFTPKIKTREGRNLLYALKLFWSLISPGLPEPPTPTPKAVKEEEEETRSKRQPIPHIDDEPHSRNQKDGNSSHNPSLRSKGKTQRGKLVIEDYENENDATQAANDLWDPPELFGEAPMDDRTPLEAKKRIRAPSASTPSRTTTSTTPSRQGGGISLSTSRKRKQVSRKTDINDDLGRLLGKDKDEKEPSIYTPSQIKRAELARREKERKEREAAKARLAKQQRRIHRRAPRDNGRLITPVRSQWEERVDAILQMPETAPKPVTTTPIGTELRAKDFHTVLTGREWLNDEIVNGYLDWIVLAACEAANKEDEADGKPPSTVPKFIAHTSFFYQMMLNKGGKGTQRLMKRKKAPDDSLLEVDSVFIPINKNNHWTLGVVRPVAKTIEYIDSFNGDEGIPFRRIAREWLRDLLGSKYVAGDWKDIRTPSTQQTNGYDCGVFVCTNALCVALGLETNCYTEDELIDQRKVVAATLLNRGFTGDFDWDRYARL